MTRECGGGGGGGKRQWQCGQSNASWPRPSASFHAAVPARGSTAATAGHFPAFAHGREGREGQDVPEEASPFHIPHMLPRTSSSLHGQGTGRPGGRRRRRGRTSPRALGPGLSSPPSRVDVETKILGFERPRVLHGRYDIRDMVDLHTCVLH